jgi:hypothetical protein
MSSKAVRVRSSALFLPANPVENQEHSMRIRSLGSNRAAVARSKLLDPVGTAL